MKPPKRSAADLCSSAKPQLTPYNKTQLIWSNTVKSANNSPFPSFDPPSFFAVSWHRFVCSFRHSPLYTFPLIVKLISSRTITVPFFLLYEISSTPQTIRKRMNEKGYIDLQKKKKSPIAPLYQNSATHVFGSSPALQLTRRERAPRPWRQILARPRDCVDGGEQNIGDERPSPLCTGKKVLTLEELFRLECMGKLRINSTEANVAGDDLRTLQL